MTTEYERDHDNDGLHKCDTECCWSDQCSKYITDANEKERSEIEMFGCCYYDSIFECGDDRYSDYIVDRYIEAGRRENRLDYLDTYEEFQSEWN